MKQKIYYYHDLVNDDFASNNIKTKKLPANYKFTSNNIFYRFCETVIRIIAIPIAFLMLKIIYLSRVKNKKVLKKVKSGYFIYGNHTNGILDAYNPTLQSIPKKAHIIVNPDAVSIKGLGVIVKLLGALPIPSSLKAMPSFMDSISTLIKKKRSIAIYPEAHIWPYYTDIRPFGSQAFHYPAILNAPSFTFTNVYVKRRLGFIKLPKVITYIDGPFYPDMSLNKKDRIIRLRNDIYDAMKKRVDENPKYEYVKYVYVDKDELTNRKDQKNLKSN